MKRALMLVLAVAGVIIGAKLILENVMGLSIESTLDAWLNHAGPGSAAIIVGLLAADVLLPIPSSVVMVLSGAAFGVFWGAALALIGSVLGEWLGFEMVRRFGRRASSMIAGDHELRELNEFFERHGAVAVMVTRPLPVVMETMSLVAGLSAMRRRTFLTASLVGTAPIVVIYAYAGAVAREADSVAPAAVIVVAVTAAAWLWWRGRRRPASAAALGATRRSPSSAASRD
jgi:uncharacterized membrane protein YdjX (TVP38/TMEM64 family)